MDYIYWALGYAHEETHEEHVLDYKEKYRRHLLLKSIKQKNWRLRTHKKKKVKCLQISRKYIDAKKKESMKKIRKHKTKKHKKTYKVHVSF